MPLPKDLGRPTNQLAELYAVYMAMKVCVDSGEKRHVVLYSDSRYTINCITVWYKTWEKNGWKSSTKEPVKHQELLKDMHGLMVKLDIEFVHVRGHMGVYGNEQADRLAVAGASEC
jgi:ribonuclease HI